MCVSGHTDLSQLLQNTVKSMLRNQQPVTVQGAGLVETFAYETEHGLAPHVLNYTNPNVHQGTIRELFPIGLQSVRIEIPDGRKASRVKLLNAEVGIPFKVVNGSIEFTIPAVTEYEVAAIYT